MAGAATAVLLLREQPKLRVLIVEKSAALRAIKALGIRNVQHRIANRS